MFRPTYAESRVLREIARFGMFKNSPDVDVCSYSYSDGTLIPLMTANKFIRLGWVKPNDDGKSYRVLTLSDVAD